MKKILLILLMVLIAAPGFSQVIEFLDALGIPRPTSIAWPLPVSLQSNASISFSIVNSPGSLGTFTLSVPLSTNVALPTAPTGAANIKFLPSQDVNYGGSDVGSGTAPNYFFQDVPGQGFFGFSDFTTFRLIGRTAIATCTGFWY